ncbi:ATPase, AAA+ type, core [Beauveria brongniartii RCEF 3172]|uniref:ATPase, AAA+ type, core n=1 Tax=Beauveria brongniartii RCEF 3172 TaxID=1081107 RepID=A0A167BKW9_9HYPO|nr:ATPase, AAA+ type, core [Beauveria brongniartii RCEF 3172]
MRFYEIDQSGTLTRRPKRELPLEEALASDGDSAPDVKDEDSTLETAQASSSNPAMAPISDRQAKDKDVYEKWLRSMERGNAVVFLLLAIIQIVFIAVASLQALATSDDESWSLRGISVEIPAGQKVSVCCRTGSGKSTFLLSLLRMVEIPISTAYIGGHVQLSIGETQFLSLTRVILYGSSRPGGILLLDEATSSLDSEAQQRMEMLIEANFQDKTIISVCQKLPRALKSDRIIVLEKGEIIHDGTPHEIVKESALFAGISLPESSTLKNYRNMARR